MKKYIAITLSTLFIVSIISCQKDCKSCTKNFSIGYRLCEKDYANETEYADSVQSLENAGYTCATSN